MSLCEIFQKLRSAWPVQQKIKLLTASLLVGNQLVTYLFVKANLFNNYSSQRCTTVDHGSSVPPNIKFKT